MRALRVKSMKEKGGGRAEREGPQGNEGEEEGGVRLSVQFEENSFTLCIQGTLHRRAIKLQYFQIETH